ncbi:MAG: tetratricopeptide repeat protein [Pyrinomonadaceae bacterium]|nr:tetratricopeptide repeat protein [Pyrinomonadaceae bacterium]
MGFKIKKKKSIFNRLGSLNKIDMLSEAIDLYNAERWSEAFEAAEKGVKDYPNERRFWEIIAVAGAHLGKTISLQRAYGKLIALDANDDDAWFGLAQAYAIDSRIALAVKTFRQFLEKFPFDSKVETAATILKSCEKDLARILQDFDLPNTEEGLELACLHEKAQVLMHQHNFERAIKTSEELIGKKPDFAPVYNNLSLIYSLDDQYEKAVEIAQIVLQLQPDNFHALANLAKFNFFLGKRDEAEKYANQLLEIESDNPMIFAKKAETFAYLGNDEAVVESFKKFQQLKIELPESVGFFKHLAAFSFYQLGNEKEAKKLWKEAAEEETGEFAKLNLEEMIYPKFERNLFAFPLNYWISGKTFQELVTSTAKIVDGKNFDKNLQAKVQQFFNKHPNVLALFSNILERSDARGKEFIIKLIEWSKVPEALEMLKNFALGKNGADSIRHQAAMSLGQADYLPNKVKLWKNDKQTEITLLCFEVTYEATEVEGYPMKPKTVQFLQKGVRATHEGNFDLAQQYYEMALNIQPNHPSLLYNMMATKLNRGEKLDLRSELESLVERFPNYTFAVLSLALQYIRDKKLKEADKLVSRFHDKKKWHVTEIVMWCKFNMDFLIAKESYEEAKQWFGMLKQFDDQHDHSGMEDFFEKAELYGAVSKIMKKAEESKARSKKKNVVGSKK